MDAVVWAMEYYQEHLRGRGFIVYTDHPAHKNPKQTNIGNVGFQL